MGHQTNQRATIGEVPARIRPALDLLNEARLYAEQTSGELWEFAVELDQLTSLGLNLNDFRWLVRKGLVEHMREVTLEGDNGREFRPTGDMVFPDRTCFVITGAGVSTLTAAADGQSTSSFDSDGSVPKPHWDAEARELRFNGIVIKRYKWQAMNQEIVLHAFEEEGWPQRIDDPLPPQPEQDPKRRLCDTIKCLNRKQANQLIRFHGDGTGEGVSWESLSDQSENRVP